MIEPIEELIDGIALVAFVKVDMVDGAEGSAIVVVLPLITGVIPVEVCIALVTGEMTAEEKLLTEDTASKDA